MPNRPEFRSIEGNRAFYSPALDFVNMPAIAQFDTAEDYYATFFHELTHATGHASRLGRSVADLIHLVNEIQGKGAGFLSLQDNIDTTTPHGKLTFHIFAAFAEFEREIIRKRTSAGLASARARGRKGGRPPGLSQEAQGLKQSLPLHSTVRRSQSLRYATLYPFQRRLFTNTLNFNNVTYSLTIRFLDEAQP